MKLFNAAQIREIDNYTIQNEPIASIDLMERAAGAILAELVSMFPEKSRSYCVIAGPGNNGGDALALARKLKDAGFDVRVFLYATGNLSRDCDANRVRLLQTYPEIITTYLNIFETPAIHEKDLIIDGLFGSGLSRPATGLFAQVIQCINDSGNPVIAIDIPSGLQADGLHSPNEPTIQATHTFSFQFPKIAFFYAENEAYVGKWAVLDIQLHPQAIRNMPSQCFYLEKKDIATYLKKRTCFTHKGTYGHVVLLAGSTGMAGAAILASKGALRAGAGLVTIHGPANNRVIVQTALPESMYELDPHPDFISEFQTSNTYDSIAVGCGIRVNKITTNMLYELLLHVNKPCVLDADALNIIAANPKFMSSIPRGSILTPHPKEFYRLIGVSSLNSAESIEKAQELTATYHVYIMLKGAYTRIITPNGNVYFNSSGNSGMATAGSGDVLTGITAGLLAQGYPPEEAAIIAVWLHGTAADLALKSESVESLVAGDIVSYVGKAYKQLEKTA